MQQCNYIYLNLRIPNIYAPKPELRAEYGTMKISPLVTPPLGIGAVTVPPLTLIVKM